MIILDDEKDENREKDEVKTSSTCVASFRPMLSMLFFIVKNDYLFDLFIVFLKLNLLVTSFFDLSVMCIRFDISTYIILCDI